VIKFLINKLIYLKRKISQTTISALKSTPKSCLTSNFSWKTSKSIFCYINYLLEKFSLNRIPSIFTKGKWNSMDSTVFFDRNFFSTSPKRKKNLIFIYKSKTRSFPKLPIREQKVQWSYRID